MRRKIVIATAAGALTLGGVGLAVPALASPGGTDGVSRIADALAGLVSDGSITQEQADEVAATLSEAGIGDRGGHHGFGPGLATAAEALGMTEEELQTALEAEGTTLADVAEEQGVSVDTLLDALVAEQEERIAGAVEDGRLTQEEADERLAEVEERITDLVNGELPDRGFHGSGERRGPGGPHGHPEGEPEGDPAEPAPAD